MALDKQCQEETPIDRFANDYITFLQQEIGSNCLIGPNAHLVGCTLEDCVFVATGVSIFHGAKLDYGAEVRINGVVHLRTSLPESRREG
jgi:carbonic anhydrase/acetyltransferase-like protein (isoleucine patch superfamily)